jgi:hypothetical protein
MVEWLAVIAFCMNDQCMFWADTKTPHFSQEACEVKIYEVQAALQSKGVKPEDMLSTCLPLKFERV